MHKPAITQVAINETIANRWSGRAYDASKKISKEQIVALLEAARWAPSCFGDQPWRFIVWDKNADAQTWQQAFDCLAPGNQTWVKDAPVLLLVCSDTLFNHNQQPNRWAQYDTGAAAENLCLQASSMDLMAHQMGGFNVDIARENFNIPAQFTPMAMICVGYPADIASLEGEVLTRETADRSRRPLNELFFAGRWGKSID
ncbi:nitroreductase family protein [Methylotenera sp.]|uniref:nitroreductase family protein n=1 Tax=Methylotenera sp. TaxID=2051956 RepID=UPI00272F8273|nr:nitroreductase family protein [Methylotenera sp.]MDP2231089.1 nitroreductase family protein [Methylotenera sp.]MDP3140221.1 nitroreductase family protein [Methylotenera sp.]